jgi:hypothetical protein
VKASREIYLKRAELAQARWNLDQVRSRQAEAMDTVERLTGELIDLVVAAVRPDLNSPEVD